MTTPNDLLDLIRRRRTARQHAATPVPQGAIDDILEAARWAPSAANRQPWHFVVVADGAIKAALRRAFLAEAAEREARYRAVTEKQADLLLAPGLIFVCGDPGTKSRYVNAAEIGAAVQEELFLLSMGAALQNMLLMAAAHGLSATWIARAARVPAIADILELPPALRGIAFLALGAAGEPAQQEGLRVPLAERRHRDRFGGAS
ncbi:MAG: nitroreductase family protein [Rhodospirillaceae bacterium]|nr:nitroreductase family protein [Rhodospirillaceae bacterium]